ncbi:MAG TPA: HAMP domain-containing histidine kinase [Caldithrix abyssi]|uniref:histidine kinase n=1 Tax=Caldithrix abyssi TaxID=187145 RepID=A0A7V5UEL8_CALAY|nr:HAMP domain-containing histidine kinase [Caldithrix abyssi]
MKKTHTLFYHIMIFILAQLAWFSLLGLWIYWYVSNYLILTQVGDKVSPQLIPETTNVVALVSGLVLLVMVSVGMSLIFVYLNQQVNLTRLYDNFISNVTHELKSPLSAIQLYLETLKSREMPPEQRAEFIDQMLKDVQRLNNLITSILYMSGLDRKKTSRKYLHNFNIYRADELIPKIVSETADRLQLAKDAVEISGQVDCPVVADANWLQIVIQNLFDNAVKYSLNTVKISVRMACRRRYLEIDVSDNGIGIRPKDQKKIFNKFQRLANADNPNVKGTGLGLYWAREIIREHGGTISVHSPGEGKGTTFTIRLPVYGQAKKRYVRKLLKRSGNKTE